MTADFSVAWQRWHLLTVCSPVRFDLPGCSNSMVYLPDLLNLLMRTDLLLQSLYPDYREVDNSRFEAIMRFCLVFQVLRV